MTIAKLGQKHDMVKRQPRGKGLQRFFCSLVILLGALLLQVESGLAGLQPQSGLAAAEPAPALQDAFSQLLRKHVIDGRVHYRTMQDDPRLEWVCDSLARIDPQTNQEILADTNAAKAFWINVYNAFTLKLICDNYPLESINELHFLGSLYISVPLGLSVWDRHTFLIGGREHTLNMVEHDILRARFKDFRLHAVLVCASVSCPPLRNEAYVAERLDWQLDDNQRVWCADESKNRYDAAANVLYLSKIFDWYESDYAADREGMARSILPYFPEATRAAIATAAEFPEVEFLSYDWSLNK